MPAFRINSKNVLFIHVPKTGGTSIATYLSNYAQMSMHSRGLKIVKPRRGSFLTKSMPLEHFHGALLEAMFAADFFDYAFMVVRNPLDRLKSEYRHSRARGHPDANLHFASWVRLTLALTSISPNLRNNHFRPQFDFQCFNAEVFKLEDGMEHILVTLSQRLGLPPPFIIPHERKLGPGSYAVTRHTEAHVRLHFHKDYSRFGYS